MSEVLYEVSAFNPFSWIACIIIIVLCIGIISLLIHTIKENRAAKREEKKRDINGLIIGIVGTIVMVFTVFTVIPDQIMMYNDTVGAYKRGNYEIVEGYVENFHPMPKEGHDSERFSINGIWFKYSSPASLGYHKPRFEGGVITGDGQHLRIGYTNHRWLGNVIVYIEQLP